MILKLLERVDDCTYVRMRNGIRALSDDEAIVRHVAKKNRYVARRLFEKAVDAVLSAYTGADRELQIRGVVKRVLASKSITKPMTRAILEQPHLVRAFAAVGDRLLIHRMRSCLRDMRS